MNYKKYYLVEFHDIDIMFFLDYNVLRSSTKSKKIMQACFIGHRAIEKTEKLMFALKETIETLINKGVTTFLFGSKSSFDSLSWEVVTSLKKKYPIIRRVYVRSSFQHIDTLYKEHLLKFYEETYFPPNLENAGKSSYIKRNYEMIDNSSFCIFYYNNNYTPPLKQKTKNNMLPQSSRNSGTKIAYQYAVRKKKEIINLYERQ